MKSEGVRPNWATQAFRVTNTFTLAYLAAGALFYLCPLYLWSSLAFESVLRQQEGGLSVGCKHWPIQSPSDGLWRKSGDGCKVGLGALKISSTCWEYVSCDSIRASLLFLKMCESSVKSFLNPTCFPIFPPPLLSWWPLLCRFAFPVKHCLVPCAVSVRPDCLPLSVIFLTWWLLLILLVWTAKTPLVSHGDQHGTRSVRWILKFSECNGKWCLAACCSKSQ